MHRFYLPPEQCRGDFLQLSDDEAHHATRVLRVQSGENVIVLDGVGNTIHCEVHDVTKRTVALRVKQRTLAPPLPCQITLLQAMPKAKAMDYIVQKATELGAARLVPILSERVVVQLNEHEAADKADKLKPVALEAIKQCGSPWLTKIAPPTPLTKFLACNESFELPLVASLQAGSQPPRECIRKFHREHQRLPRTACVWIGPEGDFTAAELRAIQASGAQAITLGRLVLRSDTAAIYALSVLNYELQSA